MENSCCPLLLTCSASFLGVDAWFCYPGVFQRCWLSLSLPLTSATQQCGCPTSLLPFPVQQGQTDQVVDLAIFAIHKVDTRYGGFFLWYILALKGHYLWRGKVFFLLILEWVGLDSWPCSPGNWFDSCRNQERRAGGGDPCLSGFAQEDLVGPYNIIW